MSEDQTRPQFEPPPWEQEAFERFRREQEKAKAQAELDDALRIVREAAAPAPVENPPASTATPVVPAAPPSGESGQATPPVAVADKPQLPEAKVEAMLIQLRGEEPSTSGPSMALINGVTAFLAISGFVILVESALLFANSKSSEAAGTMVAATMSFIVLMVGLGFLGFAFVLFRKYHK